VVKTADIDHGPLYPLDGSDRDFDALLDLTAIRRTHIA